MQIKHIRWIAVIGLLAIIELQYVWLVNTYKLTKESIQMKSDELFHDAALEEVFLRMEKYKKTLPEDSALVMKVDLEESADTISKSGMSANVNQWLMSTLHVSFQETAVKQFGQEVCLSDLDSIYTHLLDYVGVKA